MPRRGLGQKIGHSLRLVHDAVNALCRVVEYLHGAIDGCLLNVTLTATEHETKEHAEGDRGH